MLPEWLVENMRGGYAGGIYVSCPSNQFAQPLFLYEGILNFIGFILITVVLRMFFKKRIDGTLSACYLIWYGAIRAVLEGFRNEEFIMRWGNLSQSLITSIAYIILGVGFIVALYIIHYRNKNIIETKAIELLKVDTPIVSVEKEETILVKEEKMEETPVDKIEEKTPVKKSVETRKTTTSTKTGTAKKTSTKSTTKKATTTKKTQTKKAETKKENE